MMDAREMIDYYNSKREIIGDSSLIQRTDLCIDNLRNSEDWIPTFVWENDPYKVADMINLPHEDYPDRVDVTLEMIYAITSYLKTMGNFNKIHPHLLRAVHANIFSEVEFRGGWRNVAVRIGSHLPPNHAVLNDLMEELYNVSFITSVNELWAWYYRFETIHPFQDGNGRVGGIIVASVSNLINGNGKYLAPIMKVR